MFSLLLLALADPAEGALAARLAAGIAARHGAGLAALQVSSPLNRGQACVLQLPGEAAQSATRAELEGLLRGIMPPGLTADVMHAAGFLHVETLKATRILAPDLIVMGGTGGQEDCNRELSAGPTGPEQLTALSAACPVLYVPADAEIPDGPFERILTACDLAHPDADRALFTLSARLAGREGADLFAFHPIDLPRDAPLPPQEDMARRVELARERLAFLCHGLPGADRFTRAASEGAPAMEILKQARELGAELVVLACGQGLPSDILGRVLAGARCPVLLAGPAALFAAMATAA